MKKRLLFLCMAVTIFTDSAFASENIFSSKNIASSIFLLAAKAGWQCLAFPFRVTSINVEAGFIEMQKETDAKIKEIKTKCDDLMIKVQDEAQIKVVEIKSELSNLSEKTNNAVDELMVQVNNVQEEYKEKLRLLKQKLEEEKRLRIQDAEKLQEEIKCLKKENDEYIDILKNINEQQRLQANNMSCFNNNNSLFNQSLIDLENNCQKLRGVVCKVEKDNRNNNDNLTSCIENIFVIQTSNEVNNIRLNGIESQLDTMNCTINDVHIKVQDQNKLIKKASISKSESDRIRYVPITHVGLLQSSIFSQKPKNVLAITY